VQGDSRVIIQALNQRTILKNAQLQHSLDKIKLLLGQFHLFNSSTSFVGTILKPMKRPTWGHVWERGVFSSMTLWSAGKSRNLTNRNDSANGHLDKTICRRKDRYASARMHGLHVEGGRHHLVADLQVPTHTQYCNSCGARIQGDHYLSHAEVKGKSSAREVALRKEAKKGKREKRQGDSN
jgi:hypothetical protein